MNIQPWAMYTPQAYHTHPLGGMLGGIAPGTGGGQLAPQSLIGNLLGGFAGLPGQGIGGYFSYPQIAQGLGGLLPFHAAPGALPGMWGGPLAGQLPLPGLLGPPFGQGTGLPGQGVGSLFGQPQVGHFGYPQLGYFNYPQISQSLGGQLPFHAVPGVLPSMWGGPLAGQFPLPGLLGTPFGQGTGLPGQGVGSLFGQPQVGHFGYPQLGYPQLGQWLGSMSGLPPFQANPGIAAVA